jgi:type II secretory pathway component PulK
MTGSDPRRGMVLVVVLWTIALCSALAMAAAVSFRSFVDIAVVDRDRVQGDALLTAGLEVAAGLATDWHDRPLLDRETTFDLSSGSVSAEVNDEGGRIDLGKAPADLLAHLFLSVGAPQSQANTIAQSIVKWRNLGAAQAGATGSSNAPSRERDQGFFTDVSQIAEIPGIRPEWVAAIRPLTTVFGAETVNPLTAPAGVIAAIPGVDRDQLAAFLAARRSAPNDAAQLAAMLGPAQRFVAPKPQQVASVRLAATLADGYATAAKAVIVLLPHDQQPYHVLVWTLLPSPADL